MAWRATDEGTYLPTEAEIREATRRIREEGFVDHAGVFHEPWEQGVYRSTKGMERALTRRKGVARPRYVQLEFLEFMPGPTTNGEVA